MLGPAEGKVDAVITDVAMISFVDGDKILNQEQECCRKGAPLTSFNNGSLQGKEKSYGCPGGIDLTIVS